LKKDILAYDRNNNIEGKKFGLAVASVFIDDEGQQGRA